MPRRDIGGKPYHQYCWPNEDPEYLNGYENELDGKRYTWRGNKVAPIMLVATKSGDYEHNGCENQGDCQRSCNIKTSQKWDQPKHIGYPNEEKDGKQEGHEAVSLSANGWHGNLIADEKDEWFHERLKTFWRLTCPLFVGARYGTKYQEQKNGSDQHTRHTLGDGYIERRIVEHFSIFAKAQTARSIGIIDMLMVHHKRIMREIMLVFGAFVGGNLRMLFVMVKMGAGEYLKSIFTIENYRQVDGNVADQMNLMGVGDMVKDHLPGIKLFFFFQVVVVLVFFFNMILRDEHILASQKHDRHNGDEKTAET